MGDFKTTHQLVSQKMPDTRIEKNEMQSVLASLNGFPISRVWRGFGSAVFFELGELKSRKNRKGVESLHGEKTVMVEWSWRVEKARSIWFGSFSSTKKIDSRLQSLEGRLIESASLFGRLPELNLALDGGLWFSSFMSEQGQPQWAILTSSYSYFPKGQAYYKETKN